MQESLTNAAKHAPGAQVTVRLPHSVDTLVEPPETETTSHFEQARRTARRGLITAIAVPSAIAAGLIATMIGYYAYSVTHSVLSPNQFDAMRVGESKVDVELVLPDMEMMDPPRLTPPYGAGCEYYRSNGRMFDFGVTVFRVCFDAEKLVVKDVVPAGTRDIARALGDGASGFLLKSGDPRELIAGVRAVADGAAYLSPKVAARVIAELADGPTGRMTRRVGARERIEALVAASGRFSPWSGRGCPTPRSPGVCTWSRAPSRRM